MKIESGTKRITKREWAKFITAAKMAEHLRQVADSLSLLPEGVRCKVVLSIEVAAPSK